MLTFVFSIAAQSTMMLSIEFVAALLYSALSCCSGENVYCVTPTQPANTACSSCPRNSTHCATLSEYAQNAESYFTSNTALVFLPGAHTLDRNITVSNVTRLTMRGESSSARIVCNGSVGFKFENMVDFKTHSLTFSSCGTNFGCSNFKSALLLQSIEHAELVNCSFHDNVGGITVLESNLEFIGNTSFVGNNAELGSGCNVANCSSNLVDSNTLDSSGTIWASTSSLNFVGTSHFINNSADCHSGYCGTIFAFRNTTLSFNGSSNFINNVGRAIYAFDSSSLSFSGTTNFINNSAASGGAISAYYTHLSFTGTSNFVNNSASSLSAIGGAISVHYTHLSFTGTSNFTSNSASYSGGAIGAEDNSWLSFIGNTNFIDNSAYSFGGGAILVSGDSTSLNFAGTSNFIDNSVDSSLGLWAPGEECLRGPQLPWTPVDNGYGGSIYASYNVSLSFTGTSNFINNSAGSGGAIFAGDNILSFTGTISFINNSAPCGDGGGAYLSASRFFILPNTTVYWENNHAHLGGAIYVDDKSNPFIYCTQIGVRKDKCFFQLLGQNLSNATTDVQFVFKDNSADIAGSVLYGGAIDNCTLTGLNSYSSGEVFDMLVHIEGGSTTSSISSDPFRICLCENTHLDCIYSGTHTVYPGETFHVSLVAVGQRNGPVPSTVRTRFNDATSSYLQPLQYSQEINGTCTELSYTVFSPPDYLVQLELYADGPCSVFNYELVLQLLLNSACPPGFKISQSGTSCTCEERLEYYTTNCNITDGVGHITRDSHDQFWVGYDQSQGLILHPHCPLDYCVSCTVQFPLNDTDLQCVSHRSGLLCGACKKGYSLVLGTSQCKQCSNNYLALLALFAVMGIALVFFLFLCELTVAMGMLSGLVFYANIVGVNRTLFLPVETTDALVVFLAWLNLDFGVESCLYNGMDAYSKTWLQFVFPVYIWVIVGLVILVSRFSDKFAELLGNNPVSVLATLILLSYAKILRTIIAAINVTYLEYPTYNKGVWLYDANINYLSGKHIPLFLVALFFFLFLFLPYTLLLFFGQWLQAVSHLRLFAWINRLKPFMDCNHAPYKAKHRYWPGLLLVLRFGLFLIFAVNPHQDPSINLLAILVGTAILTIWAWIGSGVYRNWCHNALEGSFALNLTILAAATYHVKLSGGNQLAVSYTSLIIALTTFIGTVAYHIFQRGAKLWKMFLKISNVNHAVINNVEEAEAVEDFNQLREPLLEDLPQPNYGAF